MGEITLDEALSILGWTANRNHLACVKHHVASLRARVEKLEKALSRMVAIGYTHDDGCNPSEGRHTDGCREKKEALAQAKAALAGCAEVGRGM